MIISSFPHTPVLKVCEFEFTSLHECKNLEAVSRATFYPSWCISTTGSRDACRKSRMKFSVVMAMGVLDLYLELPNYGC